MAGLSWVTQAWNLVSGMPRWQRQAEQARALVVDTHRQVSAAADELRGLYDALSVTWEYLDAYLGEYPYDATANALADQISAELGAMESDLRKLTTYQDDLREINNAILRAAAGQQAYAIDEAGLARIRVEVENPAGLSGSVIDFVVSVTSGLANFVYAALKFVGLVREHAAKADSLQQQYVDACAEVAREAYERARRLRAEGNIEAANAAQAEGDAAVEKGKKSQEQYDAKKPSALKTLSSTATTVAAIAALGLLAYLLLPQLLARKGSNA